MAKLPELMTFGANAVIDNSVLFQGTKHHLWMENASKTKEWFATDTKERVNAEYNGGPISYVFNSDGYRCDELQRSDLLFLGCSYTFGVGLPVDHVWAKRVADARQTPYINISWPGAGASYMNRILSKTLGTVKPKYVIGLLPYNFRMEVVFDDGKLGVFTKTGGMINLLPNRDKDRMNAFCMYSTQDQEDFMFLSNIAQMRALCQAHGSEFLWSDWLYRAERGEWFHKHKHQVGGYLEQNIMDHHTRWENLGDKARDSTHPGERFHEEFANLVKGALCDTTTPR